ncbi:hypothetical protein OsJ_34541 [Oryza sativa Japonica Group]|uniref:Uncharacterized protein n=1 Tax=Oryza sativa subsp. japonica TaxID=39947 RepID=A3CD46_ORYSJ|nr:hypothetical protein OsJ_34541 [Oryza sativa Japonica Group]
MWQLQEELYPPGFRPPKLSKYRGDSNPAEFVKNYALAIEPAAEAWPQWELASKKACRSKISSAISEDEELFDETIGHITSSYMGIEDIPLPTKLLDYLVTHCVVTVVLLLSCAACCCCPAPASAVLPCAAEPVSRPGQVPAALSGAAAYRPAPGAAPHIPRPRARGHESRGRAGATSPACSAARRQPHACATVGMDGEAN